MKEMNYADVSTIVYKKFFGHEEDHENVNSYMKAVVLDFVGRDEPVVVKNDNFGTGRKYANFENGKKEAGLHPWTIVFSGVDMARICHTRYIGADDKIHTF